MVINIKENIKYEIYIILILWQKFLLKKIPGRNIEVDTRVNWEKEWEIMFKGAEAGTNIKKTILEVEAMIETMMDKVYG